MDLPMNDIVHFPTSYAEVLTRILQVDPIAYGRSRNYIDGAVTYLSPYISRGVISTKQVFDQVSKQGHPNTQIEKFIQELAWRDYWQQVWVAKGAAINTDLKRSQEQVSNQGISKAVVSANTNIQAIDQAVTEFYQNGYVHNHVRMYIAAICCNIGQSHWLYPAQWMYYYLLDGDWASNALSWQWVAGTNSSKKYLANQDNINKYCHTEQKGTFLDVDYGQLSQMEIPEELAETINEKLVTPLPEKVVIEIDPSLPTYVYNYYNLDPKWDSELRANRVLLLEPSVFKQYPISQKSVDFMFALGRNISGLQIYVGEFETLKKEYHLDTIYFKEHPLNRNYKGIEIPRDWLFDVTGYYPSFFGFWKKCKKQLTY